MDPNSYCFTANAPATPLQMDPTAPRPMLPPRYINQFPAGPVDLQHDPWPPIGAPMFDDFLPHVNIQPAGFSASERHQVRERLTNLLHRYRTDRDREQESTGGTGFENLGGDGFLRGSGDSRAEDESRSNSSSSSSTAYISITNCWAPRRPPAEPLLPDYDPFIGGRRMNLWPGGLGVQRVVQLFDPRAGPLLAAGASSGVGFGTGLPGLQPGAGDVDSGLRNWGLSMPRIGEASMGMDSYRPEPWGLYADHDPLLELRSSELSTSRASSSDVHPATDRDGSAPDWLTMHPNFFRDDDDDDDDVNIDDETWPQPFIQATDQPVDLDLEDLTPVAAPPQAPRRASSPPTPPRRNARANAGLFKCPRLACANLPPKRSDNLRDHLRRVHGMTLPANIKIADWLALIELERGSRKGGEEMDLRTDGGMYGDVDEGGKEEDGEVAGGAAGNN